MTNNEMDYGTGKLFVSMSLLALVISGNATEAPPTTISTSGSLLINTTEQPKSPDPYLSQISNDLKCARRSLVSQDYNRIFHPLPAKGAEERLGDAHTSSKEDTIPHSRAIVIRMMVDILRIMHFDEHEEVIVLLLTLRQFWTDTRIKPPPEYADECPKIRRQSNDSVRYLPEEVSKTIWFPDVYLNRVEEFHISKVLVNSEAVRVNNHGDVEYTMFGKFKLSCQMNFRNFPLDIQYCPMYAESWRIRITEQGLMWDPERPIGLLNDYKINQFSLRVVVLRTNKMDYDTGSFARIGFVLIFTRKLPFYLLQIYLPTVLFVIISWLTFFIPPPYAQGRIILTITTLLALTALSSIISKHSPSTSYLRGIDVWMQCCFLFVFVAIIDCLVDIRLRFVVSQSYKQQKPSFLLPVSVALVENRRVFDALFGEDGERDGQIERPDAAPSVYSDAPEPSPSPAEPPRDAGRRVSFADDTAAAATVSPISPTSVESGPLELPETSADPSERLERRALMFEKTSIIMYPVMFVLFNVCYWSYYLNASQPPEGLAEEISGGFTPLPRQTQHVTEQ